MEGLFFLLSFIHLVKAFSQFHAIWHVLTGYGTYLSVIMLKHSYFKLNEKDGNYKAYKISNPLETDHHILEHNLRNVENLIVIKKIIN